MEWRTFLHFSQYELPQEPPLYNLRDQRLDVVDPHESTYPEVFQTLNKNAEIECPEYLDLYIGEQPTFNRKRSYESYANTDFPTFQELPSMAGQGSLSGYPYPLYQDDVRSALFEAEEQRLQSITGLNFPEDESPVLIDSKDAQQQEVMDGRQRKLSRWDAQSSPSQDILVLKDDEEFALKVEQNHELGKDRQTFPTMFEMWNTLDPLIQDVQTLRHNIVNLIGPLYDLQLNPDEDWQAIKGTKLPEKMFRLDHLQIAAVGLSERVGTKVEKVSPHNHPWCLAPMAPLQRSIQGFSRGVQLLCEMARKELFPSGKSQLLSLQIPSINGPYISGRQRALTEDKLPEELRASVDNEYFCLMPPYFDGVLSTIFNDEKDDILSLEQGIKRFVIEEVQMLLRFFKLQCRRKVVEIVPSLKNLLLVSSNTQKRTPSSEAIDGFPILEIGLLARFPLVRHGESVRQSIMVGSCRRCGQQHHGDNGNEFYVILSLDINLPSPSSQQACSKLKFTTQQRKRRLRDRVNMITESDGQETKILWTLRSHQHMFNEDEQGEIPKAKFLVPWARIAESLRVYLLGRGHSQQEIQSILESISLESFYLSYNISPFVCDECSKDYILQATGDTRTKPIKSFDRHSAGYGRYKLSKDKRRSEMLILTSLSARSYGPTAESENGLWNMTLCHGRSVVRPRSQKGQLLSTTRPFHK